MPWKGLVCMLVVFLGFIMFLYGANYYDDMVGWTGVGLFLGGIALYIGLKLLEHEKKE